jgi:hypothetical protein
MSRKPSNISKRTSQRGAKIHTINSIDAANYPSTASASASSSSHFQIQHIPNLEGDQHAASLLRRIHSEFQLIVEKRQYILTSVTEMCCCEDGLDHMHSKNSGGKRGRKTRRMPNGVLGYNLTQGSRNGNSVHRIHLRLRHPTNHTFYPYEDIAGTMCHELAHCERGPHDAKFYKLMDEIMEQHAVYMVRGLVVDKSGFPMGNDNAHVLGGNTMNANNRSDRERAAKRRLERQTKLGGTFRLGGGFMPGSTKPASSLAHLPPAEAARRAAERRIEERRRNDSQFCLPCQDIIEILDGSSSDEEEGFDDKQNDDVDGNKQKQASAKTKPKKSKTSEVFLLDSDDSSDDENIPKRPALRKILKKCSDRTVKDQSASARGRHGQSVEQSDSSDIECSSWSCSKCTYNNDPNFLACEVCGHEQNSTKNEKAIQKATRDDTVEEVNRNEAERSKREFGGFNIYGNEKRSSSTMEHLT